MTREHRSKSVFPAGFDTSPSDSKGYLGPQSYSTQHLFNALTDQYSPLTGAELITVKAAWYGKQTISPRHEFILIKVEDRRDQEMYGGPLVNYLVLDRNVRTATRGRSGNVSQTSMQGGESADGFRVAHDGKILPFLKDCNLNPHRLLGTLEFTSEEPLYLYKLVALANVVSTQNPCYNAARSNCYMFAGVIWDSLYELFPSATFHKALWGERGKNGWYRYVVDTMQVKDTCERANKEMINAELKIGEQKAYLKAMIQAEIDARDAEVARAASV